MNDWLFEQMRFWEDRNAKGQPSQGENRRTKGVSLCQGRADLLVVANTPQGPEIGRHALFLDLSEAKPVDAK